MAHIIPLARAGGQETPPDVRPLAWVLERCPLDWWAPILDGETVEDTLVRREAARDILDELLAEYSAAQAAEEVAA